MPEPWVSEWRWNSALIGWSLHTSSFIAFVAYQRRDPLPGQPPGLPPVAATGAAGAGRFRVAIVGPACPERPVTQHDPDHRLPGIVERYCIGGALA